MELRLVSEDGTLRLHAPGVGWFTQCVPTGEVLTPGRVAGVLVTLDRAEPLIVPEGAVGRIVSLRPETVRTPVDVATVLYELAPLAAGEGVAAAPTGAAQSAAEGLVLRAPQGGRLYRSRAPGEPPLVEVGDEVHEGSVVGLIEVMKTFSHVQYHAKGDLPARARVVEFLAGDGADVRRGDPLLRVEEL